MKSCAICQSSAVRSVRSLYDDRYGAPGEYMLLSCRDCGHKFLDIELTNKEIATLYAKHYPLAQLTAEHYAPYPEVSGIQAWLDGVRSFAHCWVPGSVKVLDIGCGAGRALGYHRNHGCDAYGVDADPNAERIAKLMGYQVRIGVFGPGVYDADSFDYVTLDQVIEHFTDPVQALTDVSRVLRPGGVIIVATPNAQGWGAAVFRRRWINWHAPYHLHHFSRRSIWLACERAGLRILSRKTITHSDWLLHQWIHALMFPGIGHPSAYWSSQAGPTFFERRLVWILKLLMHRSRIDHVLSRLFDSIGIGDNQLYFITRA